MIHEPLPWYPGARAGAPEVLRLAEAYRSAAQALLAVDRGLPEAPARLLAVHAIELYLNAFLLRAGEPPGRIRGYQHDLAVRAELAAGKGLVLRRRTMAHLTRMTGAREYLSLRYEPEAGPLLPPLSRLSATLGEVSRKVASAVSC